MASPAAWLAPSLKGVHAEIGVVRHALLAGDVRGAVDRLGDCVVDLALVLGDVERRLAALDEESASS